MIALYVCRTHSDTITINKLSSMLHNINSHNLCCKSIMWVLICLHSDGHWVANMQPTQLTVNKRISWALSCKANTCLFNYVSHSHPLSSSICHIVTQRLRAHHIQPSHHSVFKCAMHQLFIHDWARCTNLYARLKDRWKYLCRFKQRVMLGVERKKRKIEWLREIFTSFKASIKRTF